MGGMVLAARGGAVVACNMGSGSALNIRYQFTVLNPPEGATTNHGPEGYLPIIPAGGTFAMQISREHLRIREFEASFTYESITGQQYESKVTLNELVLTNFRFQRR